MQVRGQENPGASTEETHYPSRWVFARPRGVQVSLINPYKRDFRHLRRCNAWQTYRWEKSGETFPYCGIKSALKIGQNDGSIGFIRAAGGYVRTCCRIHLEPWQYCALLRPKPFEENTVPARAVRIAQHKILGVRNLIAAWPKTMVDRNRARPVKSDFKRLHLCGCDATTDGLVRIRIAPEGNNVPSTHFGPAGDDDELFFGVLTPQ